MLRKFVLAAAIAAGISLSAAPSYAAATSTPSVARSSGTTCLPGSPCAAALCPPGTVCVPAPKQCFTTPCPQFDCVRVDGDHRWDQWNRWNPRDRWHRWDRWNRWDPRDRWDRDRWDRDPWNRWDRTAAL
ncbi:hypothetical protein [Microtetraspora malaysiensis]|uniref:hypothetical protein n=1 Tax=Microtetraspora malaysiensis TaxID=161358 RepID=UPI003D8CFD8C